jgi:hypothetical protein
MPRVVFPLLSILAVAGAVLAQYQGQDARKVSVSDLTRSSMMYNESPVITTGELTWGDSTDTNYNIFELRGDDVLRTVRVATASGSMDDLRFTLMADSGPRPRQAIDPNYPVLTFSWRHRVDGGMSFDKNYFIAVTTVGVVRKSRATSVRQRIEDGRHRPRHRQLDACSSDLRELERPDAAPRKAGGRS